MGNCPSRRDGSARRKARGKASKKKNALRGMEDISEASDQARFVEQKRRSSSAVDKETASLCSQQQNNVKGKPKSSRPATGQIVHGLYKITLGSFAAEEPPVGFRELNVQVWVPKARGADLVYLTIPDKGITVGEIKRMIREEAIPILIQKNAGIARNFGGTHLFLAEEKTGEFSPVNWSDSLPDGSFFWEEYSDRLALNRYAQHNVFQGVYCYVDYQINIQVIKSPSGYIPVLASPRLQVTVIHYYWNKPTIADIKQSIQDVTGWDPRILHLIWNNEEVEDYMSLVKLGIEHNVTLDLWLHQWAVHIVTLQRLSFAIAVDGSDSVQTLQERVKANQIWHSDCDPLLVLSDGTILTTSTASVHQQPSADAVAAATLAEMGVTNNAIIYATQSTYTTTSNRGCRIDGAEMRGITIIQLREIVTAILTRCKAEGWTSADPEKRGKRLEPAEVTLYDLMQNYIMPITAQRQCSYVELVSDPRQPEQQAPTFFASHYWGESVISFLACIERHAFDRDLPPTTAYWVCAYSLNQHNLSNELQPGSGHLETPFYKAIQNTKGAVAIIDRAAVMYKRIWCVFELAIVFLDRKEKGDYVYDIYASPAEEVGQPAGGIPVGLTEGPVASDLHHVRPNGLLDKSPGEAGPLQRLKSKRQAKFPLQLCHDAFAAKLQSARASRNEDKMFILNNIVGNHENISAAPPDSHSAYDHLNAILAGRFAASTFRVALENEVKNLSDYHTALASAPLTRLDMSFVACGAFISAAGEFAQALPVTLEYLSIDLSWIDITDLDGFARGLGRLVRLESLHLNMSYCSRLENCATLWKEMEHLLQLKELRLDMGSAREVSLPTLATTICTLTRLETMSLLLSKCSPDNDFFLFATGISSIEYLPNCSFDLHGVESPSIESLAAALIVMPATESFESLELNFAQSIVENKLPSVESISSGLRRASRLSVLKLDFSWNDALLSLDALGSCFPEMPQLCELHVAATSCKALRSIDEFSEGLGKARTLQVLKLSLQSTDVDSLDAIGRAVMSMDCLEELSLNFAGCKNLDSIDGLCTGFRSAPWVGSLKKLNLNSNNNEGLVLEAIDFLPPKLLTKLEDLDVDFFGCQVLSVSDLIEAVKGIPRHCEFSSFRFSCAETQVSETQGIELCKALIERLVVSPKVFVEFPLSSSVEGISSCFTKELKRRTVVSECLGTTTFQILLAETTSSQEGGGGGKPLEQSCLGVPGKLIQPRI